MIEAIKDYLTSFSSLQTTKNNIVFITAKIAVAQDLLQRIYKQWQGILDNLDKPIIDYPDLLYKKVYDKFKQTSINNCSVNNCFFNLLQTRKLRISYRHSIEKPLKDIFGGDEFIGIRDKFDEIHKKIKASRLFVATHMHAGDGNVHTNIPVNSNDYIMLRDAEQMVEEIMQISKSLGGVISGEHGIGLTKLKFLEKDKREAFAKYKQKIDPNGYFNRGKLLDNANLDLAYTPSLRLLTQEALILEATDLNSLNEDIKNCLRCGKCKPVCSTHVPKANLLYSPLKKILASGLIIDAVLYEQHTRRGISVRHYDEMNDIADHCTICHRCFKPCPVNIDFGDVSVKLRQILRNQNKKHFNPGTWLGMQFLNASHPKVINLMYNLMIKAGYAGQRLGYNLGKHFIKTKMPNATIGKASIKSQVINFIAKPLPANAQLSNPPLRKLLNLENDKQITIIHNPVFADKNDIEAVFYFPGCGSERLFSQIGLATLAMLYEIGVQIILPPAYLCCGYPQIASGDKVKGHQLSTNNRILFHRIANTLNYIDIKTVLVSCGTCLDQLLTYQFQQIFTDCRLLDIHEYLMEKGDISINNTKNYLYHDPCHTPIKTYEPLATIKHLINDKVKLNDRCCGESGTFAVARPDISTQVRFRKLSEINNDNQDFKANKILTTCPSCMQGLTRYRDDTGIQADYVIIELVKAKFGEDWQNIFIDKIKNNMEQVLL
jgi:Fe-S oxidoreductase